MTTSRSEPKSTATETRRREQADLQTAYEIHTLIQVIYGRMVPPPQPAPQMFTPVGVQTPPPWMSPMPPSVPAAWPVSDPWLA